MRVVDLDRDMSDVIPTGTTRDSAFLFDRMTEVTLSLADPGRGRTILDVASGFGQDAIAMSRRGAKVVGVEPSKRMSAWARLKSGEEDRLLVYPACAVLYEIGQFRGAVGIHGTLKHARFLSHL